MFKVRLNKVGTFLRSKKVPTLFNLTRSEIAARSKYVSSGLNLGSGASPNS